MRDNVRKHDERYPLHTGGSGEKGTQNKGQNEVQEWWLAVVADLTASAVRIMRDNVRKHDERYPLHTGGSGEKGTQNKGQNEVQEWWLAVVADLTASAVRTMYQPWLSKIYDVGKKVNVLVNFLKGFVTQNSATVVLSKSETTSHQLCNNTGVVICVHQLEANHREKCQNIVMNTLNKAKALLSLIFMQQGYKPKMFSDQKAFSFNNDLFKKDKENLEENVFLCSTELSNDALNNEVELSDEEEELRLQMEINSIMSQVGEDGLTVEDRAILRGNLPIPEEYGSYELSPTELQKVTPVKYVPNQDVYIVDEERLEAPEDWNS
jgi:hypothetical protein